MDEEVVKVAKITMLFALCLALICQDVAILESAFRVKHNGPAIKGGCVARRLSW